MIKYQGGTGVQERLTNYPGCEKILKKDLTFRSRTGILAQATLKFSVRHLRRRAGALVENENHSHLAWSSFRRRIFKCGFLVFLIRRISSALLIFFFILAP